MPRSEKRQRKKDAAVARRAAAVAAARRRRRRSLVLAGVTVLLLAGGTALALVFGGDDAPEPAASGPTLRPAPTASAPAVMTVACGAEEPPAAGEQKPTYEAPTDQKLDPSKRYLLRLETSCGTIDVELDTERAPKTSNSVAFLAREGFYDGLLFHRIVPGFALQAGDPKGDGTGGPGYQIVEQPPEGLKYTAGVVAMAKKGIDAVGTSESQFFIVPGDGAQTLTPDYALLGKVVAGMDAVAKIDEAGNNNGAPPTQRVYIEKATIVVA